MSNYYVRRNNDYLEHAQVSGIYGSGGNDRPGWRTRAHKYIAKLNIGGRVRYIYNAAQLQAAKAGSAISNVRRKVDRFGRNVQTRFNDATGISAKRHMQVNADRANALGTKGKGYKTAKANAAKWRAKYSHSLLGRAESLGNSARKFVGEQASKARKAGQNFAGSVSREAYRVGKSAAKKVSDVSGLTARKRMKAAGANIKDISNKMKGDQTAKNYAKNASKFAQNFSRYEKEKRKYSKTALGRLEGAANSARDFIDAHTPGKKASVGSRSMPNRPHSRDTKVSDGTATVKKGSKVAPKRPHSRKRKYASGTATVYARKR